MDWLRLLGTALLVIVPALAGWVWSVAVHQYGGRVVVHESESLVVVDEPRTGGRALRMLLFKSCPGLRQSEVTVGPAGEVEAAGPLHSHVNRGMALGLALLPPSTVSGPPCPAAALRCTPGQTADKKPSRRATARPA